VPEPVSPSPVALARFKRLPQRSGEVWQGGIVPFPFWTDNPADPDGPPMRPSGAIWVSLRTGAMHAVLADAEADATPQLALDTLLEFGLKQAKALDGRPARIEVRDAGLRDALAAPLAALDTSIVVVEHQPAVRDALRVFEEEEADGEPIPGLLESPGMSVERVRAFAEAAAVFHAAQPWDRLANEDLVAIDGEHVPPDLRFASVLGRSSELCGLSFFASRRAFERLFEETATQLVPDEANGVTFDTIESLPFADVDAWQDHALPVAAPDAYPLVAELRLDGPARRPTARELSFIEGVLRALAAATDDELDAGIWQARVETFDGPLDLRFSLPELLEAAAEADGDADTPSGRTTPLQQAQQLADRAMDAPGRLRLKLARQALAISDQCADAWVILANAIS
jgi:hypothetical protein